MPTMPEYVPLNCLKITYFCYIYYACPIYLHKQNTTNYNCQCGINTFLLQLTNFSETYSNNSLYRKYKATFLHVHHALL